MKIVFLVYGISWIILLLVYVISLIQVRHGKSPISNNQWYYFVFLLLFAPLVVLVIPFILISDHKKEKQNRKLKEEREKSERIMEARRNAAIESYNNAKNMDSDSFMDDCISIANNVKDMVDNKKYDQIFDLLDCISLPNGATFGIAEANWDHHISKLYVSLGSGKNDNNIFNQLLVKDSPMGAWQACLLSKLWHILPLFDHSGYERRTYLNQTSDVANVFTFDESETTNIRQALINREPIHPQITRNGNKYYIEQHFWNNWSGLVREVDEVSIENNRANIFNVESTVELEYNCGVLF